MMARIALISSFTFVLVMLASCTTVPDGILECKDEPVYRGRLNVSAADLLEYTDEVALAGADCRSKLRAVRKIVKGR